MAGKRNHEVVVSLTKLLSDSYILLLKTHNYHWNVTGPHFTSLHLMFQGQYEELFAAVDEVAERIRALGEKAPGSFAAFAKNAAVKEETGSPSANDMLKNLANDNDTVVQAAEAVIKAAEEIGDEATVDLAIKRIEAHQKAAWMLKAHLE
jgi:starvation-inducible DNA-binding protein